MGPSAAVRILLLLTLATLPFGAGASEADTKGTPKPDPEALALETVERTALIKRILAIVDIEKQRQAYIDEWMEGQETYYPRILAERLAAENLDEEISPKVTREIADDSRERYLTAWHKRAREELPIHEIYFDAYSAAFNPHFTVEELRTTVEFLETPVGGMLLENMYDIVVTYLDARVRTTELAFQNYTRELLGIEVERLQKELSD